MKKILVTGATGFIGAYVVRELLNSGHRVIASSRDPEKAMNCEWYPEVAYRPLDMTDLDDTKDYFQYFESPDIVIHLAWEGLPNYKSDFHTEINLPRHRLLLGNLVRNGLINLNVSGTCFEYGQKEGCLREDMKVAPTNPYARAKSELRQFLESLQATYPFSLKWIRLFYMFGKGQNPNSLLSQLEKALAAGDPVFNMSGGEQTRDFLPVEIMAAFIVRIALQDRVTGVINCCSGEPVTVKDFVTRYLEQSGRHIRLNLGYYPYPDYEPMHFWGDRKKLNTILNEE